MKYFLILISITFFISCKSTQNSVNDNVEKEVIEKVDKYRINDIWLLETINGQKFKTAGEGNKTPQLEIYVDNKKVIGNDGCNQIKGSVKLLDEKKIVFGMIGGTKMMCPEMETTDRFNKNLPLVKTYKIKSVKLYFYSADGKELLQFKKID